MRMTTRSSDPATAEDTNSILCHLISLLEGGEPRGDPSTWRRRLTAFLTQSRTAEIRKEAWPLLQEIWSRESRAKLIQRSSGLPRITNNGKWTDSVSLWRGDITRLEVGAIVNAANSGLTGCYIPFHACVDNAIHTAAGPWLRDACERIMRERERPEPDGTATATKGFFLPARYVLHTVGPIVKEGSPTKHDKDTLAQCYRACLEEARKLEIESVAFCAISTGIFGYPKREAASVSLFEIRRFLIAHRINPLHVILVAFTAEDESIYREALGGMPE